MQPSSIKFAAAALVLFVGVDVKFELHRWASSGVGSTANFEWALLPTAEARPAHRVARRTARRTSRRTSARVNYYSRLPAGCVWRAPYHYCGGVYYRPVVQDGAEVYVIVTP